MRRICFSGLRATRGRVRCGRSVSGISGGHRTIINPSGTGVGKPKKVGHTRRAVGAVIPVRRECCAQFCAPPRYQQVAVSVIQSRMPISRTPLRRSDFLVPGDTDEHLAFLAILDCQAQGRRFETDRPLQLFPSRKEQAWRAAARFAAWCGRLRETQPAYCDIGLTVSLSRRRGLRWAASVMGYHPSGVRRASRV